MNTRLIKAKNANLTRKRDGGYTVTITDSSNCAELNCYSTQKNKVVLLESKQIRPIEPHFYVGINLLPSGSYLDFNVFKVVKPGPFNVYLVGKIYFVRHLIINYLLV